MSNVSANSLDPFADAEKLLIQVRNGFGCRKAVNTGEKRFRVYYSGVNMPARILVIDDEDSMCNFMEIMLSR